MQYGYKDPVQRLEAYARTVNNFFLKNSHLIGWCIMTSLVHNVIRSSCKRFHEIAAYNQKTDPIQRDVFGYVIQAYILVVECG